MHYITCIGRKGGGELNVDRRFDPILNVESTVFCLKNLYIVVCHGEKKIFVDQITTRSQYLCSTHFA